MPLNIPPNLPNTPGKIQLLFNDNSNYLYSKFSPYTTYKGGLLGGILSDKQPFVYTTINGGQKGLFPSLPSSVQSLGSIVGITPDSINDVKRVSKFLISSWGVQFLITQAAIQRSAPFDETRIYNPLSPLLASVQPLTLGLGDLPIRHVEGGLLGFANSITSTVGINLTNGFQTPASTVGSAALPSINPGQGKGLIRGGDAANALMTLQSKWAKSQSSGGLGISGLISSIGASFKSFFGGAPKSSGTYRADEQAADMMYNTKNKYYVGEDGNIRVALHWLQPWYNDSNTGKMPGVFTKLRPIPQSSINNIIFPLFQYQTMDSIPSKTINDNLGNNMPVGYNTAENGNAYYDSIYPANHQQYTNSDILINFADYINPTKQYTTKLADPLNEQVVATNRQLSRVVRGINGSSNTYNATSAVLSGLLPSGLLTEGSALGYNRINTIKDLNLNTGPNSARQEYKYGSPGVINETVPKSIDETFKSVGGTSLRMATTFKSDGINLLGVLPNNQQITDKSILTEYNWTEYNPYNDDLIAFYFYDVVNSKYIPFRATVKGISEGNTAFWDELRFIGRSDQIYSYNGFSRTLSFTFNVVINSVKELLPSWKKINYLASAVKPSNYTTGQNVNQKFNRFIVPPMFMLTIGDLYKYQPMVITSINVNIPDDASWETLNEKNAKQGWSYLNGMITSPNLGKNYGQLPREAEIAVTCNLLEKERAVVGGSHFGHEPRVDDWEHLDVANRFVTSNDPYTSYLPAPSVLHQNFVEWNKPGTPNPKTKNTAATNDSIVQITTPAVANTTTTVPFQLTSVPTSAGNDSSFTVPFGGSVTNNPTAFK